MKNFKTRGLFIFILLLLFLTYPAFSQRQTGTLRGFVTMEDGSPLPGVTVIVWGPSLQGKLSFVTTSKGLYRFPALPPGKYTLKFSLEGFQTLLVKNIKVYLAKTTTYNVVMKIAKIKETVEVIAKAEGVDIISPKESMVFSKDLIDFLPANRDIYDITKLMPGTVSEEVAYRRTISVHGGSVRSNVFSFDGLTMNDPVQGYMGTNINYDAFSEVEFEAAGHPAEIGTSGGYINIGTKSGGNKLSGDIQIYYSSTSLVDKSSQTKETLSALGVSSQSLPKFDGDFGFSLGGPIKKDKLWFFLSLRLLDKKWDITKPNMSRFDYVPADALAKLSFEDEASHKEYLAFFKLSYSPSEAHKISLSYNFSYPYEPHRVDDLRSTNDIFTSKAAKVEKIPTHALYLKWNWVISENAFLDTRAGFLLRDFQHLPPEGAGPTVERWHYFDYALITNGPWRSDRYKRFRYTFQTSFSYYIDDLLGGNHEIKSGIDVNYGGEDWHMWSLGLDGDIAGIKGSNIFPVQITWYYPWYSSNRYQLWIHALPTSDNGGHIQKGRKLKLAYYLQDDFTLFNRLNINIGFRIDYAKVYFPAQHADGAPYWQKLLDTGILPQFSDMPDNWFGPRDYPAIDLAGMTTITPRIGLTYDLTGDAKTSLRLFYGEYAEPPVLYTGYLANPMSQFLVRYYWYDNNSNFVIDDGDSFSLKRFWQDRPLEAPDPTYYIDPNLKSQKTREIVVGLSREILPNFKVSVNYIDREDRNIIDDIDVKGTIENGEWIPFEFTTPGVDGVMGTSDDTKGHLYYETYKVGNHYWITNIENAKRHYRGLEILFQKSMSNHWQLAGSVTFSKTTGNIGVWYTQTNGRSAAFDSPNWDIVHKPEYRLSSDRPFTLKLQGTYIAPYSIVMSFNYSHSSGAPTQHSILVQSPGDSWDFYTYFLDEPGSIRYPSWDSLNIRIGKDIKLGERNKISLFVDIFNALNKVQPNIEIGSMGILYTDGTFVPNKVPTYISGISSPRIFRIGVKYSY